MQFNNIFEQHRAVYTIQHVVYLNLLLSCKRLIAVVESYTGCIKKLNKSEIALWLCTKFFFY